MKVREELNGVLFVFTQHQPQQAPSTLGARLVSGLKKTCGLCGYSQTSIAKQNDRRWSSLVPEGTWCARRACEATERHAATVRTNMYIDIKEQQHLVRLDWALQLASNYPISTSVTDTAKRLSGVIQPRNHVTRSRAYSFRRQGVSTLVVSRNLSPPSSQCTSWDSIISWGASSCRTANERRTFSYPWTLEENTNSLTLFAEKGSKSTS